MNELLNKIIIQTPLGDVLAVADEVRLYYLNFCDCSSGKQPPSRVYTGINPILQLIQQELKQYFDKKLTVFKTPLAFNGTDFQKTTWAALTKIPYGQTWSYAELAKFIGKPTAFRAVANANGANTQAIIVPCHRVINTGGALGGYAGGLDRKKYLLELENLPTNS